MSKVGDAFRGIVKRMESPPVKQADKEVIIPSTEQFIKTDDSSAKVNSVISEVKEEVIDPIKELIKEHPDLRLFLVAMAAGGVAGLLDKKIEEKKADEAALAEMMAKKDEEKKEIAKYLKDLKKFAGKVDKTSKFKKFADFVFKSHFLPFLIPVSLVGGALGTIEKMPVLGWSLLGVLGATVAGLSIGASKLEHKFSSPIASEDGRFLMTGPYKYATILPSGEKLLLCEIKKGKHGKETVPTKEIKLSGKPSYLSLDRDKNSFFIHYADNSKVTKFSLDSTRLQDIKP